jgi:hypothetical protein
MEPDLLIATGFCTRSEKPISSKDFAKPSIQKSVLKSSQVRSHGQPVPHLTQAFLAVVKNLLLPRKKMKTPHSIRREP